MRRVVSMGLALVTALSLAACGNSSTTTTEVESTIPATVAEEVETTEVKEKTYRLEVSEKGYEEISTCMDKYYMVFNENDIKVIDFDGNVVLSAPDMTTGESYVVIQKSKELPAFELYDNNLNLIFQNDEYPDYEFVSFIDDIVQMHAMIPDKSGASSEIDDYIYVNVKTNDVIELDQYSAKSLSEYYSAFTNDYAYVSNWADMYNTEKGQIPIGVKKSGSTFEVVTDNKLYEEGHIIKLWAGQNIGADGWVFGGIRNIGESKFDSNIFYNIFSKKYVLFENPVNFSGIYHSNIGNMLHVPSIDGIAKVGFNASDESVYYQAYDIEGQTYLGEPYSTIVMDDMAYNPYMLVETMDGKWGYVDKTFELVSELYEDAASFANGKAIVKNNGSLYIINEKFEVISEAYEGEGSSMNSNGMILVIKNGLYYPARIVEE